MGYRSSAEFLGLPLFEFRTGTIVNGVYRRGVARAWFAIGDVAIGAQAALGGLAIAGSYATGGLAIAPHANDAAALQFFQFRTFFHLGHAWGGSAWLLLTLPLAIAFFARNRAED